jgi:hypothetical protein
MHTRAIVLVPLLALAACRPAPAPRVPDAEQRAFTAAVATICEVDRRAGLSADADPLGVGAARTAWITANVDNPDSIELRTLLSVKGPSEQGSMLRDRAQELGLRSCALADTLEKTGVGGLSP